MTRALVALVAACGSTAPIAAPPSNQAPAPTARRHKLGTMVIEEYAKCVTPHHVSVVVDGVTRAVIVVPCSVPKQTVAHNGVVVTDTSSQVVDGPTLEIEAGPHQLMVRDRETGLAARINAKLPAYGSLADPQPPGKDPQVDMLVVIVHVDWIRAEGLARANLMR